MSKWKNINLGAIDSLVICMIADNKLYDNPFFLFTLLYKWKRSLIFLILQKINKRY